MSTQPTIQESNNIPDNNTFVSQIIDAFDVNMETDELLANKIQTQTLDDELLDLSINDIYESIEGDLTIDYQSLVTEAEIVNHEIEVMSASSRLILEANNPFIEDCWNETTQEISQEQLAKNQFDLLSFIESTSGPSSNILNEKYICKVVPTEFDLSVDSVFQSKQDILEATVHNGVEDKSVHINNEPNLIAVEISSHDVNFGAEKNEQTASIPTLIISKSCGDTPPPTVAINDYISLKPKKVLKAQDSLELPKDERDKFEPTKRVDSFELDDVDRNMDTKFSGLENIVNSVAECAKSNPEESSNVTGDLERGTEDDFIIVTEEEVNALKIEERESLSNAEDQTALADSLLQTDDTLANAKSKISLISDVEATSDAKQESIVITNENDRTPDIQMTSSVLRVKRLSSSQSFEIDEIVDAKKSQNYTSVLELSSHPQSTKSTVLNARKTFELTTKSRDSLPLLPAIHESTTQVDTITKTTTTTYTTSNLFTSNQAIFLDPATNITQLDEHGPLPGAY